jgi:hypothetical protein
VKLDRWKIFWGILLVALSACAYIIHYFIFRDPHHLFIFLVGDFAFVFVEVLLVTMIIHELLNYREKKAVVEKMNMIISAFFSEVGSPLLRLFAGFDRGSEELKSRLSDCGLWSDVAFEGAARTCRLYTGDMDIDCNRGNLAALREFLLEKRTFMLSLLQNPKLIDHERFTDLLWAIFHLTEELAFRDDMSGLGEADSRHIVVDIKRAYGALTEMWIGYMLRMKNEYPYLFSLAVRMNPFDPEASPEVKE